MFKNLLNLLNEKDMSVKDFGDFLGICESSARNKLNGHTEFTYSEFSKVCKFLFPEYSSEFLFKKAG